MDDVSIIENVDSLPDSYVTYELLIRQQSLPDSTMRMRKRALIAILKRERDAECRFTMVPHMPLTNDLAECRTLLDCVADDLQADLRGNADRCEVQLNFLRMRLERLPPSPLQELANKRIELLEYVEVLAKCFANVSVSSGMDLRLNARSSTNITGGGFLTHINSLSFESTSNALPGSYRVSDGPAARTVPSNRNANPINYDVINGVPIRRSSADAVVGSRAVTGSETSGSGLRNASVPSVGSMVMPSSYPAARIGPSGSLQSVIPNTSQLSLQSVLRSNAEMWKWKISFSGPDDAQSANSFLLKLNDIAVSRGVNPEDVLRGMPDILTGTAEKWFRTNKQKFTDYTVFSRLFLQDFEPSWNAMTRMDLLRTHLQQPDERIVSFFAYVENEFLTMPDRPSVDEQVRITRKLLLPTYIYGLAGRNFASMDELKNACRELEAGFEIIRSQEAMRVQSGVTLTTPNSDYFRPPYSNSQRMLNVGPGQATQPRQQHSNSIQNAPQPTVRFAQSNLNDVRQPVTGQLGGNGSWNHPITMSRGNVPQNQNPQAPREFRREYIPTLNPQNPVQQQRPYNPNSNYQPRTSFFQAQNGGVRNQFTHQSNGVSQQPSNQFAGQPHRGAPQSQRVSNGYQSFSQNLNGQNAGDRTFTQLNSNSPRNPNHAVQACAMNSVELQSGGGDAIIDVSRYLDSSSDQSIQFAAVDGTQNTSVEMSMSSMCSGQNEQQSENLQESQ